MPRETRLLKRRRLRMGPAEFRACGGGRANLRGLTPEVRMKAATHPEVFSQKIEVLRELTAQ